MLLLPDGWVCFLLFSVLNRIFSTGREWGLSAGVWEVGEVGVTGNGKGGLWEHHVAGPFILQREYLLNLFKISMLGPDCWRAGSGQQVRGPGGDASSQLLAVPTLPVRWEVLFSGAQALREEQRHVFLSWREPWPCQWSERASNCTHVMVPDFLKFPLFIAGWDKLFKVYSASSWACCEPMVLITPFPIVSDPDPWGQGFLVTQKPVLPHPVISLKKMGEQDCFLLSFDLFLPLLERFSSNKVGRQTFFSAPRPLSAPEETRAAPTRHCPFLPSPLWGSGRRWKVWNTVIALLLPRLRVPGGSGLARGRPRGPSSRD